MKNTFRDGAVLLALIVLTWLFSGCEDPIGLKDPVKEAVAALDRAIWMVENESGDWRQILSETQSKLTADAQSMMVNEVNTAFTRAIATTGVEARCEADFFRNRLVQDLTRIKATLLHQQVPDKEPGFCQTSVPAVDVSLIPQRLKWIEFYGYDFEISGIKAYRQDGDQYVDVTGACLSRPHHYLITVDLISKGCQLTQVSRRIVLKWKNKEVSSIHLSQLATPPTVTPAPDRRIGPVGGGGGTDFVDYVPLGARVTGLQIRYGARVDSIQALLNTGKLDKHGGNGGTLRELPFGEGEYITAVDIKYGTRIDQIAIRTNKMNYGPFGGSGGWNSFSFEAPAGFQIVGFFGRSGSEVDALGVIIRQRQ